MKKQFFSNMLQLRKCFDQLLEPFCTQYGLTRNELQILLYLQEYTELDRAVDIAAFYSMSRSHVSISVAHLQKLGLLERLADPHDLRIEHLKATQSAAAITQDVRQALNRFEQELFRNVTRQELDAFETLFAKITRNIAQLSHPE